MKTMKAPMKNGALPAGVKESDTKWPSYKAKDKVAYNVGDHGALNFYDVKGYGWVILTLRIGGGGRLGHADRYYGIRVSDGAPVRVGKGPHVTRTLRVYIRENRVKALEHLIQLYQQGLEKANVTRDRIGSRRFQGHVERAAGNRQWRWNS